MPIAQHPACSEPSGDPNICRFMEFYKFRDLFANEELYFCRTDLFKETDPQEALPLDDYVRKFLGLKKYVLEDELKLNDHQAFIRQHSEACYINCWQLYEGETPDMWNTYGNAVAIFSKYGLFKSQLIPLLDNIHLGVVRYGHKDMVGNNLITFLFTKRRHFIKEREP